MITRRSLEIFAQCHGDIDGYYRVVAAGPERDAAVKSWRETIDLVQSVLLLRTGRASSDFEKKLRETIVEKTDSPETAEKLFDVAVLFLRTNPRNGS